MFFSTVFISEKQITTIRLTEILIQYGVKNVVTLNFYGARARVCGKVL